jgi:hypothetical protein
MCSTGILMPIVVPPIKDAVMPRQQQSPPPPASVRAARKDLWAAFFPFPLTHNPTLQQVAAAMKSSSPALEQPRALERQRTSSSTYE